MIHPRLRDEPLIRLEKHSKVPVVDVYEIEPPEVVEAWVRDGGNYGVSLVNDLVVLDIDSERLQYIVEEEVGFPETFSVITGSMTATHEYYRCPGWGACRQFSADGVDLGSLRSDGWQVAAPPSVHPDTGNRYQVLHDAPIREVEPELLAELLDVLDLDDDQDGDDDQDDDSDREKTPLPGIPDEYPGEPASWPEMGEWLEANGLLDRMGRLSDDQSGDEWVICKCLAEGGFAVDAIREALDHRPASAKWHRRGREYRERTIRSAIQMAREDEYVEW